MILGIIAAAFVTGSYIDPEYQELCQKIGEENEIRAELMISIIEHESSGRADVVSQDGKCVGLCQLNTDYFSGDLTDPETNITIATEYLADLIDIYGSTELALMKYHGEANAEAKYSEGVISNYAAMVIERAAELEKMNADDSSDCDSSADDGAECPGNSDGEGQDEPELVQERIQRRPAERTKDRDTGSSGEAGSEDGGCGLHVSSGCEDGTDADQGGYETWDVLDVTMPSLSKTLENGYHMSLSCSLSAWKNYQSFQEFLNGK